MKSTRRLHRRTQAAAVVALFVVPLAIGIVLGVMCSPTDGFIVECHEAGGHVIAKRDRYFSDPPLPRLCLGPNGFIPIEDTY